MILVPYTPALLRPETARWGILNDAVFYDVSSSDTAYWELLLMTWAATAVPWTLFVVEHDIVPDERVFREMNSCSKAWCTSPYQIRADGHQTNNSLGCARFSTRLQIDEADLIAAVGPGRPESQANALWSRLDGAISAALNKRGYQPHVHGQSVHLHDYTDPRTPWVDPYGGNNGTR